MNTDNNHFNKVEFAKLVIIGLGILTIAILFILLLKSAVEMLLLIFAGVLFAIFVRGVNRFLFGRLLPLPEKIGITITVLLMFVSVIAYSVLLAPQLVAQGEKLIQHLPDAFAELRQQTESLDWLVESIRSWSRLETRSATDTMTNQALGFFASTFGVIFSAFIILFVGLYLSFSPKIYIKGILHLFPAKSRERAAEIFQALDYTLAQWLVGRFIAMLFVTVFIFSGLFILQVPLAYSLATLSGVLTFIPNFGPIVSAIPAILLGFNLSPLTALYVTALYIVVHFLDAFVITPLVQQREVSLPPVLTLSSQIVLGSILGLLGLALATPITGAAMVLVKMLYIDNILGEEVEIDADISASSGPK